MSISNPIKAIILAAGEGSRLRPYTGDRPKCLVEVGGKSLLERQLDVLRSESVEPVILIGGYRAEMLESTGLDLRINPRYAETNMVWTLFCAEADLNGELLVCYGDIVYSRHMLDAVLQSTADIAVAIDLDWEAYWRARNEDPLDDAETLKLSAEGSILEIGQKPTSLDEIEGQYMGLMKFSQRGIDILIHTFDHARRNGELGGKPAEKAYMTDLLQAMIDSGHRLEAVKVRGAWVEVDTVADLESPVTRERLNEIEASI